MIFRIDYKIKSEKKDDKEYIDNLYKEFCKNYINQIKSKLNFKSEFLSIIDSNNQQIDIKDKVDEKEVKLKEESKTIDVIRFEMEMIIPTIKKDIRKRDIKPQVSRAPTESAARARKEARKVI